MALVPPVPMPKQDLRDWALKTANYLQLLEKAAEQPSPKVVQLERKQPTAKATTPGVMMFDQALGVPVYSFNKAWHSLVGSGGEGFVMPVKIPTSTGDTTSLVLYGSYPSIIFQDTTPAADTFTRLGVTAGNGSLRFGEVNADGTQGNDWFRMLNPNGGSGLPFANFFLPVHGYAGLIHERDVGAYFQIGSYTLASYGDGYGRMYYNALAEELRITTMNNAGTSVTGNFYVAGYQNFGSHYIGTDDADTLVNNLIMCKQATALYRANVNAPAATTAVHYFRGTDNANQALVYGAGTASQNAATIITREKGDLRYAAASSRRFKRNISRIGLPDLVAAFDALSLSRFDWGGEIPEGDERFGKASVGLIAEEVVEVLPEAGQYFNTNFMRTTSEVQQITRILDEGLPTEAEVTDDVRVETNEEVAGPLVLHGLDANVLIAMLFAKIKQLEARIP